jgi:hypothetical protein
MTARPKRPRDPAQLAKLIVDIATGEVEDREPTLNEQGKDPAAVAMGRKGGAARAKSMTPQFSNFVWKNLKPPANYKLCRKIWNYNASIVDSNENMLAILFLPNVIAQNGSYHFKREHVFGPR